ncbi:Cytochrome b-c1 complex subunit 6, mitochondrial [Frankliniella fusca]|uniref:Cytochrome b-c1 complex subunit 6 n=1 Tax=Frankliniella fusca TaxID=407009 RepID=A0AAE1LGF7_9NEOP|nr:Cytochrome b-c1 complex subunit 6, mitochondrial [Frankliniella fusca]
MSWFGNFFASRFLIKAKAQAEDEDIVDPQEVLREKCKAKPKCVALLEKLDTCNARVRSKKQTAETCAEEIYDWMHCVDHCVSHDLFKQLK